MKYRKILSLRHRGIAVVLTKLYAGVAIHNIEF